MAELEQNLVNIESVNRSILEIATNDMEALETKLIILFSMQPWQNNLLQYSNCYRSFDERIPRSL